MIAAPAVDVKQGRCVQLVGGKPGEERVSLPDPPAVARHWCDAGFRTLHVVDLDAALGLGENRGVVGRILRESGATVQVGGGIRDERVADELLEMGADRIVVGTRALEEPRWLATLAEGRPGRVLVAADVREGEVVKRGWTEGAGVGVSDFLKSLAGLPLAGVLWTDVDREGRMQGVDPVGVRSVIGTSSHAVWVSGGVRSMEDLVGLSEAGAAGAVLGMALYQGALDPGAVAAAWGSDPGKPGDEP